jgi:hypothetical protein
MKMPRLILILVLLVSVGSIQAQWRNTKHHFVASALVGASYNPGNIDKPAYYQLTGRGMYYWKKPLALGGEASFTRAFGQYTNYDAGSLNAFAHLKLPLGLYIEAGMGAIGTLSDGRSAKNLNAGRFLSAGWTKSFGPVMAMDLQYRKAPSLQAKGERNLNSGLRFGLSFKL